MKKTLLSLALIANLGLAGCSTLSELIEKPDEKKTVEEFYKDATEGFAEQQWDIAIENYEKLKAFFPYGAYAEQSYLELSYAYYKYDEPESAIRELEEFIRLYPKHTQLPYAYYLRALSADSVTKSWLDNFVTDPASRDTKSAERAFSYYSELTQLFPDSEYTGAARERLIVLRNQMARRELLVAQFYMERQAYNAAISRAKIVLEKYPRAASTGDALQLLINAYDKMGMVENRDMVAEVYKINLGNLKITEESKQLTAQKEKEAGWWSKITQLITDIFD